MAQRRQTTLAPAALEQVPNGGSTMHLFSTLLANRPPREYSGIEEAFFFIIAAVLVSVVVIAVWRIDKDG